MSVNRYTIVQWAALLAIGIWIGMLVFLGLAVAPSIFKFMDSRTQAGLLNGIILSKMNILELVCALILLTTAAFSFYSCRNRLQATRLAASALLLINLGYYSLVLTPRMEEVKRIIPDFDIPRSQDTRPEREEFDHLHTLYSSLVKVNIVLLLALSLLITNTAKQDDA